MLNTKNTKLTPYMQIQLLHKIIEQDHYNESAEELLNSLIN